MRLLYLNPFSGIAGDMAVGALLDLGADTPAFWEALRSLPLPAAEWQTEATRVMRHGISATHYRVHFHEHAPNHHHDHGEHHHHRHLPQIREIIQGSNVPAVAQQMALATFEALAEAEGKVHNIAPEKVHFHEVGAVDAIADIVGACLAVHLLGVDGVCCGPIALGQGTVRCAHGEMPVPVPAVTRLLEDAPTRLGSATGELTTPTGAALLRGLQASFGSQPAGRLLKAGYGAGTKDFPDHANVLQALLLETAETADATPATIEEIACNLDDLPGERLSYLTPRLFAAGALDVSILPCTMKKGRPGFIIQVMAPASERDSICDLLLRETSTFGVRWHTAQRSMLRREMRTVHTDYGPIKVKLGYHPESGELLRIAPEYESCQAAAKQAGCPLDDVYQAARTKAGAGVSDTG